MNARILIVDDAIEIIEVMRVLLEARGFIVETTENANKALDIIQRSNFDVVISDEIMPGMSGIELLTIIKERNPDTLSILMTGGTDIDIAIRAVNSGAVYRFFTKPCKIAELVVAIRQGLENKELLKASKNLFKAYRRQGAHIDRLEREHPGLTKLQKTDTGSIVIDLPSADASDFLDRVKHQLEKDGIGTDNSKI